MYNRYTPQQDGSHRKNRMEEPSHPTRDQSVTSMPPPPKPSPPAVQEHKMSGGSIGGFLRQLIPKDFDTGDLIVVLLLLLMAGDKPEDKNTALLTLALYCFL